MNIKNLFKRVYSHFFQTMPGEMTMKGFWSSYRLVANRYLNGHYDLTKLRPENVETTMGRQNIFVYWNNGFDTAPKVVKRCLKTIKANVPKGWQLHIITDENLKQYVMMPDFVEEMVKNGKMCRANYSDILRLALLWNYGGLWLDATCFLTQGIPQIILDSPLFLFNNKDLWQTTPFLFESWVMRSVPGNYIIGRVLENLLCYFLHCKKPRAIYFVCYYMFSALYLRDNKAKELFDNMPWWYAKDSLLMQIGYGLNRTVSDQQWQYAFAKSFVQKLKYQYPQEWNESTDTIIGRVLREK